MCGDGCGYRGARTSTGEDMSIRYQFYNASDDGAWAFYSNYWLYQTFTVTKTHLIDHVRAKLARGSVGTAIGTVTAGIRALDSAGKPTGSDLAAGTINGNTLVVGALNGAADVGRWYTIKLVSGIVLPAGTQYAKVLRAASGDGSNRGWWQYGSSDLYSGGSSGFSNNSGSTWQTPQTTEDMLFEEGGSSSGWLWGEEKNLHAIDNSVTERVYAPTNNLVTYDGVVMTDRGDVVYN